jgi:mannonate dehydratase
MKLGLGLYRHMLAHENYQFARQAGATHIVAHLVDYFAGQSKDEQPLGGDCGWGRAGDPDRLWTTEELLALRREINEAGLQLAAIENLDPAHWYDVLLGGPRRDEQIENVKTIIRRMGEAEIPVLGYNFSIAGVCGRVSGPFARGGAVSVGMDGPFDQPMPQGMAWNMIVSPDLPGEAALESTSDELWQRLEHFLHEIVPVAEESGVVLAAHPDDPPMPTMRGQPRLVYEPQHYQRLLDLDRSPANALEFCIGSIAEMTTGDVYQACERYSHQRRIAYLHFRNVKGKVPEYKETFLDDGDVDMLHVLGILKQNQFDGVMIPDHTPQMTCDAPWHAGMAYALGYMRAAMQAVGCEVESV